VLLYYQLPSGGLYFGGALTFTFSNSLSMTNGNFVALYYQFGSSFTVTATDSANNQNVVTTISTPSNSMLIQTLVQVVQSVSVTLTVQITDAPTGYVVYGTPFTTMLCGPSIANGVVSPPITNIAVILGSGSSPSVATTCTSSLSCVCTIDGQAC